MSVQEHVTGWQDLLASVMEDFKVTGGVLEDEANSEGLTIDSKEVGTIIRSIGLNPTMAQVDELLVEMKVDKELETVEYKNFYEVIKRITKDTAYKRDDEERLYSAFLALDVERKGYLTRDELKGFMTEEGGEPLDDDEIEEMLTAATDPKEGKIYYEEYIYQLAVDKD